MLFSEVHSAYFSAVSKILMEAMSRPISAQRIDEIVRENAFSESVFTIGPALRSGEWPLLTADGEATIHAAPSMPLTMIEKRWLKALLLDPRIALFDPPETGLEDVEPLFDPSDVYWFDRYLDGDPYQDPGYITNFRTVLQALKEQRKLRIVFNGNKGSTVRGVFAPNKIEYSEKDDKFRLLALAGKCYSIRLSSMLLCELDERFSPRCSLKMEPDQLVLELLITDERNAMERAMLHFSHFKKEAERVGDNCYKMKLWYERESETEMVIRVLSFGPMVRVLSPDRFRKQVVDRLQRQMDLFG